MELKSILDTSKMSFVQNFDGKNVRVILGKGRSAVVCTCEGEYKGTKYFHVRELRDNYGEWAPAKGISVRSEDKKEFLRQLALEYANELTKDVGTKGIGDQILAMIGD